MKNFAKALRRPLMLAGTGLLVLGVPLAAQAQAVSTQTITGDATAPGNTRLTVNAEGTSTRTPDMATFSAGVTTQGDTASAALSANSRQMNSAMAALKRAGIAARDIQTSNLSLNPVYSEPARKPDGSYDASQRKIVGYEASNTVTVRARKLDAMGQVIDALVAAGANQINGPNFMLSEPQAAQDEARIDAMKSARAQAELYAKAAGLRIVRVISISENGGGSPSPVMFVRKASMMEAAPPVAAGELETQANVSVQYELAPKAN